MTCFGFLNGFAMDLAAFKANLMSPSFNQGAEVDDSIECYLQRLKKIRQKTVTTIHKEPAHQVNAVEVEDAQRIHEETAAKTSAQILESKLQLAELTDTESVSTEYTMSDQESDDADKSSDGDHIDEKAFINHKIFRSDDRMEWPSPLAAFPGAHFIMRPRVGPRGGLILQPRRPSLTNVAPTHTVGDLNASSSLYSKIHGAF